MNINQMAFRCPSGKAMGIARLEGYCLVFRNNGSRRGVATIQPELGSHVDGVLWNITQMDEKYLDHYEGYPRLYGKENITVKNQDGSSLQTMVYVMNAPYKDIPALPDQYYLEGILNGCKQNGISTSPILKAVKCVENELPKRVQVKKINLYRKGDQER